ncbi:MAG TPA: FtsQ-type POTRA domain-containing protein [Chloroflexi bacterium]|nr:FtsQ-type POTRA domain-containing protein [Chloroflexota bacterium]
MFGRRSSRKRRKQPRMRRMDTVAPISQPRLRIPKAAKKRRRRNRRQRVRIPTAGIRQALFSARWISLTLLAFTVYAIILTGQFEDFYLTQIPVEGVVSIPAAEVVEASRLAGVHIFATDPNEAAQNIMALPGITAASVKVTWPNKVAIAVEEDTPIAVWQDGRNQYWVTKDGGLIPARTATVGLLTIEAELTETEQLQQELAAEAEAIAAEKQTTENEAEDAATTIASPPFLPHEALVGALQLRQLRPNIDRLYFRPGNGLSYQDGRGWRVYFGTGNDMEQKLVVYETIVEELLAQGITPVYISVANQERPYYKAQ